jgi:hypothetical protein
LANKRMALALMARSHSWMDVGLHTISLPDIGLDKGESTPSALVHDLV